ncbi:MAG: hypothetical protein H6938_00940 [Burkholderiales bacterium]|nr:hypothetical protein [Burkholderiales bacterium]
MNERAEINELSALFRARVPLILIETHEEPRILRLLTQAASLENQLLMNWSIVDGLGRAAGSGGGFSGGLHVVHSGRVRAKAYTRPMN